MLNLRQTDRLLLCAQLVTMVSRTVLQDGDPLIQFPTTFSAQVHLLMESRKRRGLGAIMSDDTPASHDKKCARDRLPDSTETDTGTAERSQDAQTLEMVKHPYILRRGELL